MAWRLAPDVFQQTVDANGNPAIGYTLEAYIFNTTTPTAMATDGAGSGQATSFTFNSRGVPATGGGTEVSIYLDTTQTAGYKFILKDASGATVRTYAGPVFPIASSITDLTAVTTANIQHTTRGAVALVLSSYLNNIPMISAQDYGLVGDDSDESALLAAAFADAADAILVFPSGKTYRSTTEQILPANARVYLGGSTLKFVVTGAANCLLLRDYCEVSGGTVELAGSAYSGHGFNGCPILIGNYETGQGYHGCTVDITIKSNKSNGNGVGVTGDSSFFNVRARVTENSATLGRVVAVHWGGATTPSAGTFHPHDGFVHVMCRDMSYNNIDVSPVHVSGAYNVTVSGDAGDITNGRAALVFVGDYGAQYASAEVQQKFMRGIIFKNYSVESSLVGVRTQLTNVGGSVSLWPCQILLDGINIKSNASSTTSSYGVDLTLSDGVTIVNSVIDGFYVNFRMEGTVNKAVIKNNIIRNAYTYAINTGSTSTPNFNDVVIEENEFVDNNTQGTASRADILMNYSHRWHIRKNTFNSPLNTWAIRGANTSTKPRMYDNETLALVGAGPAISMGISTDYDISPMGSNNTAATGITPYGGCPLFTINQFGNREFFASAAPSSGAWIVGDKVHDSTPVSGAPMGWVCTVAGTPGTWTAMANYA